MLPVELYRGEDALRRDREAVLRRSWQFVGHVQMLAGQLDIDSRPGRGTRIVARIPLAAAVES